MMDGLLIALPFTIAVVLLYISLYNFGREQERKEQRLQKVEKQIKLLTKENEK